MSMSNSKAGQVDLLRFSSMLRRRAKVAALQRMAPRRQPQRESRFGEAARWLARISRAIERIGVGVKQEMP